jgi:hypothetical protein
MDHEVPLTLYALEQSFRRLRVALVTLFNDILLFLHIGSASGILPVRGALVIASFVSVSPASAPAEGPLCLRFKKHHPLSRLTPI